MERDQIITAEELHITVYEIIQTVRVDPELLSERVAEVLEAVMLSPVVADFLKNAHLGRLAEQGASPAEMNLLLFAFGLQAGLAISRRRAEIDQLRRLSS